MNKTNTEGKSKPYAQEQLELALKTLNELESIKPANAFMSMGLNQHILEARYALISSARNFVKWADSIDCSRGKNWYEGVGK